MTTSFDAITSKFPHRRGMGATPRIRLWATSSAALIGLVTATSPALAEETLTREQAVEALQKAIAFFHDDVSTEGGYLWRYSADLAKREGEGKADDQTIWVQPPGTPSVGQALLYAYHRTGDGQMLNAAHDAGTALVRGQLRSGGWDYRIHFDERRAKFAYRTDPEAEKQSNVTTLDDNTTQSATRFLMDLDRTLKHEDKAIHEAALTALNTLLDVQYPNGAWPQRFTAPPDPNQFPVKKARYPETWSRTFPKVDYRSYYTFNDNTISDTIALLFDAAEAYNDDRYYQAAIKAGDFILLAQMPEPQPAWAQQYNADMEPAWARKFEPPAVTGGESQGIMRALIDFYLRTGESEYLDAVDRASAYLFRSELPDGKLARFYELHTNKPLYFTKDYQLTYDDSDMPTHYSFKANHSLVQIQADVRRARATVVPVKPAEPKPAKMSGKLKKRAQAAIDGLDGRGAWVEQGKLKYHGDDDPTTEIIDCATFARNVRALADFIEASD